MFAKRFFYVSAAILCLAVAYHLGARSATAARAAGLVEGATIQIVQAGAGVRASGAVDRKFYIVMENGAVVPYPIPIPGRERIVATNPGSADVMLENGDLLRWNGTEWARTGNLVGPP